MSQPPTPSATVATLPAHRSDVSAEVSVAGLIPEYQLPDCPEVSAPCEPGCQNSEDCLRLLQANSTIFLYTLPLQVLVHDHPPLSSAFSKP